MSYLTVRVVLHGAEGQEGIYEDLHSEMAEEGFRRFILSSEDIWYKLPQAEYTIIGDWTTQDILGKASRAAKEVWDDFGILVTPSSTASRRLLNLKPATPAELKEAGIL